MNSGDELDVLRDALVEHARRFTGGDDFSAASTCFTAAFTIMTELLGEQHAVNALREIVNAVATRMTN